MKKNEAAAVSWSSTPSVVVEEDMDERTLAADVESLFAPVPQAQPPTWDGPSSSGHSSSGHSSSGHSSSGLSNSGLSNSGLSGSGFSGSSPSGSGFTGSGELEGHGLRPGTRIQHYELIRELGSGGMGTVFLARDTRLGRRVAIKFLHTQDADVTKRFILEARTTARCSHENIVIIYEVGESQAGPFMVLEFLEGQPLMKVMGKQRLPPSRAVELMVPVVRALACAHEQGIVHRDLKPENIVVTNAGAIKVLDFGIAKVLQGDEPNEGLIAQGNGKPHLPSAAELGEDVSNLTRRGAIMGTMAYMAPEQWGIGVPIDHRADIWAVGIMLFRMIAGKHPLDPLRGPQLMVTAMMDEAMPRLQSVVPDVPPDLAAVIDRCLLKPKDERFPDANSLLKALEPFLPGRYSRELRIDESPYAGLSSFQEADADRFFGRTREIAALVNRISDRPLLAVVGPSGTGKSSFVRAGLVPVLKRSGTAWESLVIRPGRNPLAALANIVAPLVSSSTTVEEDIAEQQRLVERLHAEPGYVGSLLRSRARRERRKILLFIDQFEELYTLVPDVRERMAFTACLSGIADDATSPIRVILSIRSDFLDRVPEDEQFMGELSQGLYFLTAPNRDGLRDALVQPAEMAGYQFETPAMVDNMLEHLDASQGALPLLQFAATQLWESRDTKNKLLTESAYQSIGGIAGALATHADSVLASMSNTERTLVRAVFLRLVTPERTRAIVSVDELRELTKDSGEMQRLIDHLVQARLLVVQTGGGATGATVEIVHESLLHSWPTLKRWLDEGQEDAGFLEQLRNAARQWQAKNFDNNLLWRGEMVEEALRFQRRFRGELPQLQQDYLTSVFAQAKKGRRLRKALLFGGTTFLGLLVIAAAVALVVISNAQREAERQAEVALKAEAVARTAEQTARSAEVEAKERLAEVQAKELERQKAQQAAEAANAQAALANQELLSKNDELLLALQRAQEAQLRAKGAKRRAESSAREARQAKEEAIKAAQSLANLLRREQERAQRLQSQLGSPVIEVLK
ncbi:serine/threonine protein kinase [Archangium gephyra]|uniref:High-affnity carbon uptake protein Hat/HatR n=1 Tax=Archangium gephyra TaxID=48 RepID=A0AAC8TIP9_9BACT|nr:serine/threonine-protein kinase [Archangium gephyra]AKJ07513.1 High-affnity carbon uptake protein Hat/HatR [Archangium gephyra]REG19091.1 serine/threonine protein kinase [Archangium gephyra]